MKSKKLTIILLVLAIVTTLSAGTLAIYTTTFETQPETTVATKRFIAQLNHTDVESFQIAVAPGETAETGSFEVTNEKDGVISEVDMDLELAPIGVGDFTADYKKFTIRLYQDGAEIGVWNESQKDGSVKLPKAFAAGVSGTHTYKVSFTWNDTDNNAKQTGMGQNGYSKSFKFSIKATQSVAASANNGQ